MLAEKSPRRLSRRLVMKGGLITGSIAAGIGAIGSLAYGIYLKESASGKAEAEAKLRIPNAPTKEQVGNAVDTLIRENSALESSYTTLGNETSQTIAAEAVGPIFPSGQEISQAKQTIELDTKRRNLQASLREKRINKGENRLLFWGLGAATVGAALTEIHDNKYRKPLPSELSPSASLKPTAPLRDQHKQVIRRSSSHSQR